MVVQECSGLTGGATTQSLKGSAHEHKDLNSVPQSPYKKPGMVVSAWGDGDRQSPGAGRDRRSLGLEDGDRENLGLEDEDRQSLGFSPPPSLDESQTRERLCLKNK